MKMIPIMFHIDAGKDILSRVKSNYILTFLWFLDEPACRGEFRRMGKSEQHQVAEETALSR